MSLTIYFKDGQHVEWGEGSDVRAASFVQPPMQSANFDALEIVDHQGNVLGAVLRDEVRGYKKYVSRKA